MSLYPDLGPNHDTRHANTGIYPPLSQYSELNPPSSLLSAELRWSQLHRSFASHRIATDSIPIDLHSPRSYGHRIAGHAGARRAHERAGHSRLTRGAATARQPHGTQERFPERKRGVRGQGCGSGSGRTGRALQALHASCSQECRLHLQRLRVRTQLTRLDSISSPIWSDLVLGWFLWFWIESCGLIWCWGCQVHLQ